MIELIRSVVIPAAFTMLPAAMSSPEAVRMLLAIGWQESRFLHRRQLGGPARGFWQFETSGVRGVLAHPESKKPVRDALMLLRYPYEPTPHGCHAAIEHNDLLACVFARLYLWTLPDPLPHTADAAWRQYLAVWRPGKPHPDSWGEAWRTAEALA